MNHFHKQHYFKSKLPLEYLNLEVSQKFHHLFHQLISKLLQIGTEFSCNLVALRTPYRLLFSNTQLAVLQMKKICQINATLTANALNLMKYCKEILHITYLSVLTKSKRGKVANSYLESALPTIHKVKQILTRKLLHTSVARAHFTEFCVLLSVDLADCCKYYSWHKKKLIGLTYWGLFAAIKVCGKVKSIKRFSKT